MPIISHDELAFSPDDDCRGMLHAFVQAAKRSVHVNIYALSSPALIDILIAQHQAGIDVHVVADHSQAVGHAEAPQIQRLANAGVDTVIATSPTGNIDHEKVVIVDWLDGPDANNCAVGYGSYNFSESAQAERNYFEQTNDAARVARFFANWQSSHDWGVTHHPEWQIKAKAS